MDEIIFNQQLNAAAKVSAFASVVDAFVTDDNSALESLRALHERIRTLSDDYHCPRRLYYLAEDLCDLLADTHEHWESTSLSWMDELDAEAHT